MSNIIYAQDGTPQSDPAAKWLLDYVDEWRVGAEKQRFDPGWFHCSQLGESDEKLIAQYRGVLQLEPRTARELRVFDNGHDRDGSWKRYLRDAGLSVVAEDEARSVSVPYLRLRGTLDDIAHHPETGAWYVVEFKTINPYAFGQLQEPKPEHLLQVTSYMGATQIDESVVIYENKGNQSVRAFYAAFDKRLWSDIVKRLLRLRREAEAMDAVQDPKVIDISRQLNAELAR